jgi:hypothetical protein
MSVWDMGEIVLNVHRENISYIQFILEGYDGLGNVTTKDPISAQIAIRYPVSRKVLITSLIHALYKEGVIREDIDDEA